VAVVTKKQGPSSVRTADSAVSRIAWALWVGTVALLAVSVPLNIYIPILSFASLPNPAGALVFTALAFGFSTIGALVTTRQPRNLVGWIMLFSGVALGATLLTTSYTDFSLFQRQGTLPGTSWAAWFSEWLSVAGLTPALTFLVLLFPDGRLPSRRWRVAGWLAAAAIATLALGSALTPASVDYPELRNPVGLSSFRGSVLEDGGVGWLLLAASVVVSAISMVVRFRRASGEERQQIKWFALAATLTAASWTTVVLLWGTEFGSAAWALSLVSYLGIPLAVGVAVLKYRLYDVDIIINRALIYGSLTATLALVYFGGVTLTQSVLQTLTGREELPQLAVVASTLAIAALFQPLRRRIQSFIDRRFYRSKYDARRALETFSSRLRDQTDLEELDDELVGVVRETLQPAHITLWLRPDTPRKDGGPE